MGKTRCKEKDGEKKMPKNPKFKCKECGGLAKKKKKLCKPDKV